MANQVPKAASVRARRNKASTRATLYALTDEELESIEIPELPDFDNAGWHPATRAWWEDIWSSPMMPEWDESDIHGLYILAVLVDGFWHDPSAKMASEIRQQRVAFGLTPLDRRRLEWEIDRGDKATQDTKQRRTPKALPPPDVTGDGQETAPDPRTALA